MFGIDLNIVWGVLLVASLAAIAVMRRRNKAKAWAVVVAGLVVLFAALKLFYAACDALDVQVVIQYGIIIAISGGIEAYRWLRGMPRRWYDGVLIFGGTVAVIGFVEAFEMEAAALLAVLCALVALVSLAVVIVRLHRMKEWGIVDMLAGVVFMACAVKFWQIALGLSWLGAVGLGTATLVVALLVYYILLFCLAK